MAASALTRAPVNSETSATASVMPAEGPSLGTAPMREGQQGGQGGQGGEEVQCRWGKVLGALHTLKGS